MRCCIVCGVAKEMRPPVWGMFASLLYYPIDCVSLCSADALDSGQKMIQVCVKLGSAKTLLPCNNDQTMLKHV